MRSVILTGPSRMLIDALTSIHGRNTICSDLCGCPCESNPSSSVIDDTQSHDTNGPAIPFGLPTNTLVIVKPVSVMSTSFQLDSLPQIRDLTLCSTLVGLVEAINFSCHTC